MRLPIVEEIRELFQTDGSLLIAEGENEFEFQVPLFK
jgi:hypothetical protein